MKRHVPKPASDTLVKVARCLPGQYLAAMPLIFLAYLMVPRITSKLKGTLEQPEGPSAHLVVLKVFLSKLLLHEALVYVFLLADDFIGGACCSFH